MKNSKSSSKKSEKPSGFKNETIDDGKLKVVVEGRKSKIEKKENLSFAIKHQPQSSTVNHLPSSANLQTMESLLALEGFSPKGYKRGDVVTGRISSISGKEVLIDIGGKMEGVVGDKEWESVRDFVAKLKVGDKIPVTIISPETDRGQMIISIRQAGSKFRWQKAHDLLKSGEAVPVRGVEVNKGGLLVEFEGIRGFIPGSQLSGEFQGDMNKLIGKTLQAKVIEVDQAQNRLIFSQKAVAGAADLAKKLEEVRSKVKIGDKYKGKVSAVMPYGIFVNLENGADGLVHISEISWTKVENLAELFKVGDKLEVLALGVSETDAKLNLSLKQLQPDPWLDLAKKYSPDQEIKGKVTRVSNYGVFVQLEEGVEGLVHISKVPAESDYKAGDKISCTIESVDSVAHRISLIPVLTSKPMGYK